jgi:phosphatidylglycerophosphate synthase
LVLTAVVFLFFNLKFLFILFTILAYTFDNVDGIWARLKKQTSKFGGFFDGFMDSIKYFTIDIGLIILYFDKIQNYVGNQLIIVLFFSLFFALREFYALSFFQVDEPNKKEKMKLFDFTSGATRYFIIFPLVILVNELIIFYFLASFLMFLFKVLSFVLKRFHYQTKLN